MIWQDILVDRELTDAQVASAIMRLFGRGTDNVLIAWYTDLPKGLGDDVHVLVERYPSRGDFLTRLQIILRDDELEAFVGDHDDSELIGSLSALLGAVIFIDDGSLDPSSGLLIRGKRQIEPAYIDVDDDEIEFKLIPVPEVVP